MATSLDFICFVCEQLRGVGEVRFKKMFGEYMVYVNDKPVVIVCDETAYVKKLNCITELMKGYEVGCPYEGAKEHYVLDVDDEEFCRKVVSEVEKVTPVPKTRKKKGSV